MSELEQKMSKALKNINPEYFDPRKVNVTDKEFLSQEAIDKLADLMSIAVRGIARLLVIAKEVDDPAPEEKNGWTVDNKEVHPFEYKRMKKFLEDVRELQDENGFVHDIAAIDMLDRLVDRSKEEAS